MTTSKPSMVDAPNNLTVEVTKDQNPEEVTAQVLSGPFVSNAMTVARYGKSSLGPMKLDNIVTALVASAKAVKAGDLAEVEELLMSQAKTLNVMFGELAARSAANAGQYFDASQRYMSMALKAQNQCRMTLETLGAIRNPPVVYARQANIANGPQLVDNRTAPTTRAENSESAPNKLLEVSDEMPMDPRTAAAANTGDKAMAAMGEVDRTNDS